MAGGILLKTSHFLTSIFHCKVDPNHKARCAIRSKLLSRPINKKQKKGLEKAIGIGHVISTFYPMAERGVNFWGKKLKHFWRIQLECQTQSTRRFFYILEKLSVFILEAGLLNGVWLFSLFADERLMTHGDLTITHREFHFPSTSKWYFYKPTSTTSNCA